MKVAVSGAMGRLGSAITHGILKADDDGVGCCIGFLIK